VVQEEVQQIQITLAQVTAQKEVVAKTVTYCITEVK